MVAGKAKPTRSEELRLKKKIELAESGHSVLEKKRDNLIHEFMDLIPDLKEVREQLRATYGEAEQKLKLAEAFEGVDRVRSIADTSDKVKVEIDKRNIMGTEVPDVELIDDNGEGTVHAARIETAKQYYRKLLQKIIDVAQVETAILSLLEEIESTKRRVNALEYKVIPELQDSLDYVSQALEESQRESTFRIKKFKEKE